VPIEDGQAGETRGRLGELDPRVSNVDGRPDERVIRPQGGDGDRPPCRANAPGDIDAVEVGGEGGGAVAEGDAAGEGRRPGYIGGAAEGLKVSEKGETPPEDAIRGFLGRTVSGVLDHVPVAEGNAALPGVSREGGDEGGELEHELLVKVNEAGGVSIDTEHPEGLGALAMVKVSEEGMARDEGVLGGARPGAARGGQQGDAGRKARSARVSEDTGAAGGRGARLVAVSLL